MKKQMNLPYILWLVQHAEDFYEDWYAQQDATNRSYVRGAFWANRTDLERSTSEVQPMSPLATPLAYQAQQNEIWPAIENKVTLLIPDMPACAFVDLRDGATSPDGNTGNSSGAGRRRAAVINYWVRMDHLRPTLTKWIQQGLTYNKGGLLKVEWDMDQQRPIVRERLPWEVMWDPTARHVDDVAWYFEKFELHIEEFKARLESGDYQGGPEVHRIKGEPQSRSKIELYQDDAVQKQKERELEHVWVPILEFWDCRHSKCYHIHVATKTILRCTEVAIPRPYVHLLFNYEPGKLEGVCDVTHAAPLQQQLNEMVSARQDCVRRLSPKLLGDAAIFSSEDKQKQFENAKMTAISWVNPPQEDPRGIGDYFFLLPAAQLPPDWNAHYNQVVESIRYILAIPEFQRGQVENIRTAQEAYMVQQAATGRLASQAATLKAQVVELMEKMAEYLDWAVRANAVDLAALLAKVSTSMVDVDAWREELQTFEGMLTVNAFSPLMDDPITAQSKLEQLLPAIASYPPMAAAFSWYDVAAEVARSHGWGKEVMVQRDTYQQQAQAAQAPTQPPPGGPPPEGAPDGSGAPIPPGVIPPELAAILGGAGATQPVA
jgi:hypothetical protein